MAGAGDALHRGDRYHPHFYRTAGGVSFQHLQQVTGGGPQRRLRRVRSPVEGGGYFRDGGRPARVRLACWHDSDRTCRIVGMCRLSRPAAGRTAPSDAGPTQCEISRSAPGYPRSSALKRPL